MNYLFLSLFLLGGLCANTLTLSTKQMQTSNFHSTTPTKVSFTPVGSFAGTIQSMPQDIHALSLTHEATLVGLYVLPFERVKKGQKLAQVKSQAFIQAQSSALQAMHVYNYQKELTKRNKASCATQFLSQNVCLEDEKNLLDAKLKRDEALTHLKRFLPNDALLDAWKKKSAIQETLTLFAPHDGTLADINYDLGARIAPLHALFTLYKNSKKALHIALPQHKAQIFHSAMQVEITIDDTKYSARVLNKSNQINSTTQMQMVHFLLHTKSTKLLENMRVYATLFAHIPSLRTPKSSVILIDNLAYVFSIEAQTAVPIPVEVLYEDARYAYLKEKPSLNTPLATQQTILLKNIWHASND